MKEIAPPDFRFSQRAGCALVFNPTPQRAAPDLFRWSALRLMKRFTHTGVALITIFSLSVVTALADDTPSGLSAHIATATNRVHTLSHLEFSVTVTNSGPTNITINPWILKNGLGTVQIYDARGMIMAYQPEPPFTTKSPTPAERAAEPPQSFVLKPGEFYALKYRLGEHFFQTIPSGIYRARGFLVPSNQIEITVE